MSSSAAAMTAILSSTGTVTPSPAIIFLKTPVAEASIVFVSLSVSTSNSGSPSFTASPSFFSQLETVPSVIVRPSLGITTTLAMLSLLFIHKIICYPSKNRPRCAAMDMALRGSTRHGPFLSMTKSALSPAKSFTSRSPSSAIIAGSAAV